MLRLRSATIGEDIKRYNWRNCKTRRNKVLKRLLI